MGGSCAGHKGRRQRTFLASILMSLFIVVARCVAAIDLGCPTFSDRKRNCLLRLETSIVSLSVMVSSPLGPQHTPISAKFLTYSQPRAPHPTMNIRKSPSSSWNRFP